MSNHAKIIKKCFFPVLCSKVKDCKNSQKIIAKPCELTTSTFNSSAFHLYKVTSMNQAAKCILIDKVLLLFLLFLSFSDMPEEGSELTGESVTTIFHPGNENKSVSFTLEQYWEGGKEGNRHWHINSLELSWSLNKKIYWTYELQIVFVFPMISWYHKTPVTYGWNQPGREKAKKLGILPFTYWVLLTTFIFFALLEIVMCLKHIEASHIMSFNSWY